MPKLAYTTRQKGPSGAEIADWIRNRIRSRRFVPGQRLVEFEVTRRTGGSRFKVREALQRLQAEGLVEIEEYRGASVRSASMDEVRQLYRARAVLEGLCAADFTRNATSEQRDTLLQLTVAIEQSVESGAPESFGSLNAQWHALMIDGSGNPLIHGVVQRLNTPIHHLLFETFYRAERLRSAAADHRDILEAIRDQDPHAAEYLMRRHVEAGLEFLSRLNSAVHFEDQLD